MTQPAAQLALLDSPADGRNDRPPRRGRFEPAGDPEAAAMGRALLAELRGEELTVSQRALLARARAEVPPEELRAPTPVVDASETLLTLGRGEAAEVRLSWRRYRGSSPFLDLRRFERGDRGAMRPTRQGVTIRGHEVSRLLTALVKLQARDDDELAG